jgi:prepilin-type N-terminal cleavage/methylation domain-containing protein
MTLMRAAIARLRSLHRDQKGMTLMELMVSVALMVIVVTIFTTVLMAIQRAVMNQQGRSETNDQARAAMEQMDREIRSGNMLYDPTDEALGSCGGKDCVPSYTLRVYTQVNAPTRTPPQQCVQWVIDDDTLFRRAWAPGATESIAGWRTVATGVVNQSLAPAVPAFSVDSAGKVLDITLMLNSRLGSDNGHRTVRMNTSIAARNTATGDPCSPIPST